MCLLVSSTSIKSWHVVVISGKIIINSLACSCDIHDGLYGSTYHFNLVIGLALFGRVDVAHGLKVLIVLVWVVIKLDLRAASRADLLLGLAALKDRPLVAALRQATFFLRGSLI